MTSIDDMAFAAAIRQAAASITVDLDGGWSDLERRVRGGRRRTFVAAAVASAAVVLLVGVPIRLRDTGGQSIEVIGRPPSTPAPPTTVSPVSTTSVPVKGRQQWLVSMDTLMASSQGSRPPASDTDSPDIEPARVPLGSDVPFVRSVVSLVHGDVTFTGGSRIGGVRPVFAVSFVSPDGIGMGVEATQLDGPIAPTLLSDEAFSAAHRQDETGLEIVTDAADPNNRIGIRVVKPDGHMVSVGVSNHAPARQRMPYSVEQIEALALAVASVPLPD